MSTQFPCIKGYCFNGTQAVDGIYRDFGGHEYTSVACTNLESNTYMVVDLGETRCINAVKLWNRGSGTSG